ncbi:unnamed protein product, partial [Didymodactylos carnosus]
MKCGVFFYKSLIFLHAFVAVGEFICVLTLLILFVIAEANNSSLDPDTVSKSDVNLVFIGLGIGWLGAIVPTFIGFIILILLQGLLCCCICFIIFIKPNSCGRIFCAKSIQRLITLECNCPCYIARPKLRFINRFIFLFMCLLLRLTSIIIYMYVSKTVPLMKQLAILTAISIIFLICTFFLDFYHYWIWWHYYPSCDIQSRRTLSRKHKRYLPYHLLGDYRTMKRGDYPCKNVQHCQNRQLEHIMIFHSKDYFPQPRWSEIKNQCNGIYIGFHRTTFQAAVAIAHSDFRGSEATANKSQMLGF